MPAVFYLLQLQFYTMQLCMLREGRAMTCTHLPALSLLSTDSDTLYPHLEESTQHTMVALPVPEIIIIIL